MGLTVRSAGGIEAEQGGFEGVVVVREDCEESSREGVVISIVRPIELEMSLN